MQISEKLYQANYGVSLLYNHIWDSNAAAQPFPFEGISGKRESMLDPLVILLFSLIYKI